MAPIMSSQRRNVLSAIPEDRTKGYDTFGLATVPESPLPPPSPMSPKIKPKKKKSSSKVIQKYDTEGNVTKVKKIKLDEFGNPVKKKKKKKKQPETSPRSTENTTIGENTTSSETVSTMGFLSANELFGAHAVGSRSYWEQGKQDQTQEPQLKQSQPQMQTQPPQQPKQYLQQQPKQYPQQQLQQQPPQPYPQEQMQQLPSQPTQQQQPKPYPQHEMQQPPPQPSQQQQQQMKPYSQQQVQQQPHQPLQQRQLKPYPQLQMQQRQMKPYPQQQMQQIPPQPSQQQQMKPYPQQQMQQQPNYSMQRHQMHPHGQQQMQPQQMRSQQQSNYQQQAIRPPPQYNYQQQMRQQEHQQQHQQHQHIPLQHQQTRNQQMQQQPYMRNQPHQRYPQHPFAAAAEQQQMLERNSNESYADSKPSATSLPSQSSGSISTAYKLTKGPQSRASSKSDGSAFGAKPAPAHVLRDPPQEESDTHHLVVQYMISAGAEPDVAEEMATRFEEQQQLGMDLYAKKSKSHDIDKFAMFGDRDEDSVESAVFRALEQGAARAKSEENERHWKQGPKEVAQNESKYFSSAPPPTTGTRMPTSTQSRSAGRAHSLPSAPRATNDGEASITRALLIEYMISMGTDPEVAEQMTDQFQDQQSGSNSSHRNRNPSVASMASGGNSVISREQREALQSFHQKHMDAMNVGSPRSRSAPVAPERRVQSLPTEPRRPPQWPRVDRPGAFEIEGRAFGAPRRPERAHDLPEPELLDVEHDDSNDPQIIEARPVDENELGGEVVYAETATFGIKYMLREPKFRLLLVIAFLFIVGATVGATVLSLKGSTSADGSDATVLSSITSSPTDMPSSAPTRIDDDIERAARAISGLANVLTEGSPQRRAVSWLSSVDQFDTQGLGLLFSERYILTVFYFATNGENWLQQDNWISPTLHVCDWSFGIQCMTDSTRRRVATEIDMTKNGLSGSIPYEIILIEGLTVLKLPKNSLNGTIPAALTESSTLKVLDLSVNQLSGAIPSQIGTLEQLLELDLYDNALTGTIPSSIFNLMHLEQLDLAMNKLNGTVSSDITKLENLNIVNLQNNELGGVLPRFSPLPKLDFIFLDNNRFTGKFRDFFDVNFIGRLEFSMSHNRISGDIPGIEIINGSQSLDFYRIQKIDISFNQLTGTIPALLSFLPSVKYIDVSANKFSGPLPVSGDSGWQALEYCGAANNQFTGTIPLGLSGNITSLDFSGNLLTGNIPLELYTKFTNLEFLALNDNPISGRLSGLIGNLIGLRTLQLSNCNLTGPIPDNIMGLASLEQLSLANNGISGSIPTSLASLSILRKLELANNNITGPLPSELGSLTLLNVLNVANNSMTGTLSNSLGLLASLGSFDVSGNDFVGSVPDEVCIHLELTRSMVGCDLICNCCIQSVTDVQCERKVGRLRHVPP